MKAVFIVFDQALRELVTEALNSSLCKGFTMFPDVWGKGSVDGEPHMGTHAWPTTNSAVLCIADDERIEPLLERLHKIDLDNPLLGLRAFIWSVEKAI